MRRDDLRGVLFSLGLLSIAVPGAEITLATQRPRPPASLTCTRDHLTAYQGRVLDYKRGPQEITVRILTDEDTNESVSLKWTAAEKPETWLLLRGAPFKSDDWKLIESGPGKLNDGMQIIAWVCDNGSKPVLDWRPAER
jgi:hypothetical protein